jgi:dihydrodipicolinate synthase/N-acetylneuraminate lyase
MNKRFQGVHTIMPTPFKEDGSLDLASLETLTEFLIGLEVDGLVVLGVMGEAPKLSQQEQDAKEFECLKPRSCRSFGRPATRAKRCGDF